MFYGIDINNVKDERTYSFFFFFLGGGGGGGRLIELVCVCGGGGGGGCEPYMRTFFRKWAREGVLSLV